MLAILSASFNGCKTLKGDRYRDFSRAPLFGMIYDTENRPCSGARIVVDEKEGPRSDINGRFVLQSLGRGEHRITVQKEGYETLSISFEFLNKNQVLYLRVVPVEHLLRQAESALADKKLAEAGKLLDRAFKVDPENPVGRYLQSVLYVESGQIERAVATLEHLLDQGFREAPVLLALADLYQYRLGDLEKAAALLAEYLRIEKDPEIEKRLEGIRGNAAKSAID
jgi:tetratricopeptide (TPR) repeat protein